MRASQIKLRGKMYVYQIEVMELMRKTRWSRIAAMLIERRGVKFLLVWSNDLYSTDEKV